MPSPSPTSRRNSSSSLASRNLSGSSRGDLVTPRGLNQSFQTNSTGSAASRALQENNDDHKENSMENGNSRGAPGRSNQNLKGPSKKPWVTHFAKPATTLSPSNRVLVDRNSSCSPVRLGSIASGNGETLSDKKVARATTPREQEEVAPTTPGPVKGVAELSKRIQQFLEDQDLLLGVKTGSCHEVTSACPSVTPVESGQLPLSSPYNPYKSPFCERPKFLRLNGNVSPMEGADIIAAPMAGIDMLMEPSTEELPLFEGDQVLVTPLQPIQFSTSLSPSSTKDEEVRLAENAKEQIPGAIMNEEASLDALEAKVLLILEGEANSLHESNTEEGKERMAKTPEEDDEIGTVQYQNQFQDGDTAKTPEENYATGMVQAQNQFQDGDMARQAENPQAADIQVKDDAVTATCQEDFRVFQDEDQNLSVESARTDEEVDTVEGDDVSWGKKAVRLIFCGALLATFLALVLLSSASPGLLPPSLVNNPINSFWKSSKYHEHSVMLVRGMDGLWSTELMYFPADVHVAVLRGVELFHQAHQELQLYVQVASSILDDLGRVLVQRIPLSTNHGTAGESEDRARQFEWIQDYDFEEEWVDEIPKLSYTDWELLHEYDLGAANHFVGSIPEILEKDLRKNFSRLSDSPEVKDLLEDLMTLKGGSTEEDRLEVLQYFWEYRRFSASVHESLMNFHEVEMNHDQGEEKMHSEHMEEKHYQTPTQEHSEVFEDAQLHEQHIDKLAEQVGIEQEQIIPEIIDIASENLQESMVYGNSQTLMSTDYEDAQLDEEHLEEFVVEDHLENMGMEQEQIFPEIKETASEKLQESMVYENSQTFVSTGHENDAVWTDLVYELQREVGNVDTSSIDIQPIPSTPDVILDIAQLATLATFIVASFYILGRNRQPRNVTKVISHASSVQFLRKFDQPPNNLDDETQQIMQPFADVKQEKKQVTMIEELNDRFASVLQSPEPNILYLKSPHASNDEHARKDEDLIRSPIPASANSPYGSFTTYKLMSKKEGQASETKLTPVRRSSRIRNHVTMSPSANGVKRIAISPP